MNKIQIVLNSDRCHVSVNGTPEHTFIFSAYNHSSEELNKDHAIETAKSYAFDCLAKFQREKINAFIDTKIESK